MLILTLTCCILAVQNNYLTAFAEETGVYTFAEAQYEDAVAGYNGVILKKDDSYFFKDVSGNTKGLSDFGQDLVLKKMMSDSYGDSYGNTYYYAYALIQTAGSKREAFISADGYWYGGNGSFYDEIVVRDDYDKKVPVTQAVIARNKVDDTTYEYYLLLKNGETLLLGKQGKYTEEFYQFNSISYIKYGNRIIAFSEKADEYQEMLGNKAGFMYGYNPDDGRDSFLYVYNAEKNLTTVYDEYLKEIVQISGEGNIEDVNTWYREGYIIVDYDYTGMSYNHQYIVIGKDGKVWGDASKKYKNLKVLDSKKGIWYADDGYVDRKVMDNEGNVIANLGDYVENGMTNFISVGSLILCEKGSYIYMFDQEDNYSNPICLTEGSIVGATEFCDSAIIRVSDVSGSYCVGLCDEDGNITVLPEEYSIQGGEKNIVEFGNVICMVTDPDGKKHWVTKDGKVSDIKLDNMSYTYVLNGIVQYTLDNVFYAYNYNTNKVILQKEAGEGSAFNWFYSVEVLCNGKYLKAGGKLYDSNGRQLVSANGGLTETEDGSVFAGVKNEDQKSGVLKIGVKPLYEDEINIINGWQIIDGNYYWYENDVKQGTEGRGKEIYDPGSDAWYWLDSVQGGAKAVSKDVYQESYSAYPDRGDGTGKWVRYDAEGHMVKGWQTTDKGTYYFESITGAMAKGNVIIDGQEYHFDEITGILVSGGSEPYYTDGWNTINGVDYWYENGVRQGYDPDNADYRGKEIYDPDSDAWYWLDNVQQGAKAVSKDVYQESYSAYPDRPDGTGKWVRYDENGHMVKGWQTTEAGTYYFESITGAMAKGSVTIDGENYYFDENIGILIW